jgi:hypothetical protein
VEIVNTHYADDDKDYPLFMEFYQPDAAVVAERAAKKARHQAGVDGRKPTAVLAYLQEQVSQGYLPELVTLAGPQLSQTFITGLAALNVPGLGVSGARSLYTQGQSGKQKAKTCDQAQPRRWLEDLDLGYRRVCWARPAALRARSGWWWPSIWLIGCAPYLVSADTSGPRRWLGSTVLSREQPGRKPASNLTSTCLTGAGGQPGRMPS